jgi:hypothetical protein
MNGSVPNYNRPHSLFIIAHVSILAAKHVIPSSVWKDHAIDMFGYRGSPEVEFSVLTLFLISIWFQGSYSFQMILQCVYIELKHWHMAVITCFLRQKWYETYRIVWLGSNKSSDEQITIKGLNALTALEWLRSLWATTLKLGVMKEYELRHLVIINPWIYF